MDALGPPGPHHHDRGGAVAMVGGGKLRSDEAQHVVDPAARGCRLSFVAVRGFPDALALAASRGPSKGAARGTASFAGVRAAERFVGASDSAGALSQLSAAPARRADRRGPLDLDLPQRRRAVVGLYGARRGG